MIDRRTCPYSGRTIVVELRRWYSTAYWKIPHDHGPVASRLLPAPRRPVVRVDRRDRRQDKRKRFVQALRPRAPQPKLPQRRSRGVRPHPMIRMLRREARKESWYP